MKNLLILFLFFTCIQLTKAQIDANFTADKTTGCDNLTVKFTDSSTGNVDKYNWDFGDVASGLNNTSTLKDASHIYSSPGSYTVKLTVFNNSVSNTETKSAFITVSKTPVTAFDIGSVQGCVVPITVTFTNNTTGSGTSLWDFGDSTSSTTKSPSHTYTKENNFTVTLTTDNNGCKHSVIKSVNVNTFKTDFKSDTTVVCEGSSIKFTDLGSVAANTWSWSFGDGTTSSTKNPTKIYAKAGTYTVKLISSNSTSGCKDSLTKSSYILVNPKPSVDFTALDDTLCEIPASVTFSNNSPGATKWNWDFGNLQTSTVQTPTAIYTDTGAYTVKLLATNANGCTDSITKTKFIHIILPEAGFTILDTNGCKPFNAIVTDTSKSPYPINQWEWDFQHNGSIDLTVQNPTFVYPDTGSYTVSLIITNTKGCKDTVIITESVDVGQPAIIDFTPKDTTNCHKFTVPFKDGSSFYSDQWFWSFGDGATSNLKNPTNVYSDTGYFNVSLYTKFHDCPSDTLVIDSAVHVLPSKPVFSMSKSLSCDDTLTVKFTDNSQGATDWFWDFGDGAKATGAGPHTHFYSNTGFYTTQLKTENSGNGCADSISQIIKISDGVPQFSVDTVKGCQPLKIDFTDLSVMNPSFLVSIASLNWTFGDGGTSTDLVSTSYTYQKAGFYDVRLIVTDDIGCKDTILKKNLIEVKPLPVAGFFTDTTNGCAPLKITFTDTSSGINALKTWIWNYGDGSPPDAIKENVHFYPVSVADVSLIVIDTFNCSSKVTKPKLVNSTFPKPVFTIGDTTCNNTLVKIKNSSTGANINTFWNYGDNSPIDTTATPSHTYKTPSGTSVNFDIKVIVTDSNKCTDSLTKTINVFSPKAGFVIDTTTSVCPPLTVTITDKSSSDVDVWQYFMEDHDAAHTINFIGDTINKNPPVHTYDSLGYFDVRLIVIDTSSIIHCADTLFLDSAIRITGPTGSFKTNALPTTCDRSYFFTATTKDADSLTWYFGDGSSVDGNNVTHYFPNSGGTFKATLVMKSNLNNGCKVTRDTTLVISSSILVPELTVSTTNTETDTPIQFKNTSKTLNTITVSNWFFGDGDSIINLSSVTHQFLAPGTYIVTLAVKDSDGCIDSVSATINVTEKINEFPTVFSPNGDGINDSFRVPNNGTTSNRLVIYNRWGEKLFDQMALEVEWFGFNFGGTAVPDGTYYYVVESVKLTGENQTTTGYITLFRK